MSWKSVLVFAPGPAIVTCRHILVVEKTPKAGLIQPEIQMLNSDSPEKVIQMQYCKNQHTCGECMNPKCLEARDEKPFVGMRISTPDALERLQGRSACGRCYKSRKYFCYTCCVPVPELQGRIPQIRLPIKIDIIKHRAEIDGKSTAIHAAVLAPHDVSIYTYPDVPAYGPDERTVLIYPSVGAATIPSLFTDIPDRCIPVLPPGHRASTLLSKSTGFVDCTTYHAEALPIDRAVFIDSTWNQSRGIYKDERIRRLPAVVIQSRASQFWRHQKNSPRWYLSTVEAVHQLLVELHVCAWGRDTRYEGATHPPASPHTAADACTPYDGQYDDLLFFFKHMYEKIHTLYDHENLLAYKRPML